MRIRSAVPGLVIAQLALVQPAWAQHVGHDMTMPEPETAPEAPSDPHAHHHAEPEPASDPHAGHAMPHKMAMPVEESAVPSIETPPPPEAGSGPARAADAIWGADAMKASRTALAHEMGAMTYSMVMADRLEYRAHKGGDSYLWDVQGWYGGDIDRLWIKSEGEGAFGEKPEDAEVQALWSHAIGAWFDLQAGVRQDFAGPDRTHAVIGIQGLAPYKFELDAAAFVSNKGDVTARIEAELDQRITQRLVLQPRGEITLSAQDIPELGVGSGLDKAELGIRLRYEVAREFAPYIGVEREWRVGGSADYARMRGERAAATSFVAGIRAWF